MLFICANAVYVYIYRGAMGDVFVIAFYTTFYLKLLTSGSCSDDNQRMSSRYPRKILVTGILLLVVNTGRYWLNANCYS